ncbi:MAG: hypothetical protein BWY26_00978 [Elusimicrobia bacterium ADurb.Bin231]|nr:MAG: hypothetical protein BWY26_00978 [Elusimicrobia bacterium ADurb.Bin231]
MTMDTLLRKHDIDVGKTFGILLFAWAIGKTYDIFFTLLYRDRLVLNIGILILIVLASGMYRHSNNARKWCLGLTWFIGVAIIIATIVSPFTHGDKIIIAGKEFPNPPIWKSILTDIALLPTFLVVIRALTSEKAKEEFGLSENCA